MSTINANSVIIDRRYTMAVTGHRRLKEEISKEKLKTIFECALLDGYDTFLVGMALGFDMLCFKVLEEVREENNIRIIACVPCEGQALKYPLKEHGGIF